MRAARHMVVLGAALFAVWAGPSRSEPPANPNRETADPPGLPAIGKWMLTAQGVPSDWLGEIYQGKVLREPINVILIDEAAASGQDAVARLLAAAARAGYPVRFGHSTGYQAVIGGELYAQLPKGWDDALSDEVFELSNNHGRVFGPYRMERSYLFTGAFSRERVDPFRWPGHRYGSFNQARDDFAARLDRGTAYKAAGFVQLDNSLSDDPAVTTGDHDGRAVVLRAGR
ncbi:hypothetical protein [Microvirga makkahensis]|uniref:Uncharacterized protein n=1 Tax=Microvirga makkahensis TaxID=1128670 RepID=A0A7X3SQJ8_9HYPH|nr:hypothetical protein [Microvirga makkahensis]MXQ13641.1 hypothetical protein [Microvirga makkahensis]